MEIGEGGVADPLVEVPTEEELFEMLESGELDGSEEAAPSPVAESDVASWALVKERAVRAAGHRGTWAGRRGTRERTFADRDRPPFVGRYAGKAAVTPQ